MGWGLVLSISIHRYSSTPQQIYYTYIQWSGHFGQLAEKHTSIYVIKPDAHKLQKCIYASYKFAHLGFSLQSCSSQPAGSRYTRASRDPSSFNRRREHAAKAHAPSLLKMSRVKAFYSAISQRARRTA